MIVKASNALCSLSPSFINKAACTKVVSNVITGWSVFIAKVISLSSKTFADLYVLFTNSYFDAIPSVGPMIKLIFSSLILSGII